VTSPAPVAMRLRAATPADAEAVADVLCQSRRVLMPFVPQVHDDDDVRGWVGGTLLPGGGVTVAEVGDEVVGVLAVSRGDGLAWIDQLYVHPGFVARGIGHALLQHALATLTRPVQLYTFQANARARGFYERRGFVAVALSDGRDNEEQCPDVLYRLDGPAACAEGQSPQSTA
jgi:ribosomal protein S18 acetylase RimI-like enzyme